SWNTADYLPGGPDLDALSLSPPAQSVNQPSPPSEQSAAAPVFGGIPYMPPPVPDLSEYVGPGWIHGNQRAPENLMRGMHRHDVLPSAERPWSNIMINGRFYTAYLGASKKKQRDIRVYLNE
ncbi:hypothetical protein AAFX91_39430, partial [Bradyrhizobium sp. 31Argb]